MHELRLKPGRERSVLRRHPWIFSGAIARVDGHPESGDTVEIIDHNGQWLARAAYSPHSQIRARIWSWDRDQAIDGDMLQRRLLRAREARSSLASDQSTNAYREVHAESDGIPGLIVDRYNQIRVVQILSAGVERWREAIVDAITQFEDCHGIYERSDVEVRQLEGMQPRTGHIWGSEPGDRLTISEYGLRYYVDIPNGQKTGFYLDQRENRRLFRDALSGGEVLNCFSYTGGFTVAALTAGVDNVLSIDTSSSALELAVENVQLNELPVDRCQWIESDVFAELRRLRDRGRRFDAIVLDPPRFAGTAAHVEGASRGYKDINLLAFKLLRPGGLLFTFSCSNAIGVELFQKIVAGAALDAGAAATIVGWLGQPADHLVSLNFPEGRYLKGLICRVVR